MAAMSDLDELPLGGTCDPRFARVREAFAENFSKHGERGGAVTVSIGGRNVVDLWGGWADVARTRPWARDTIVNVFSVGKAMNAIAVLRQVEAGRIALDDPVARVWPEFGVQGKDAITLRMLLSHRAGLPALRDSLPDDAMLDWDVITSALAAETPWWAPDTGHGYHVNTFGFLTGEVVRRAGGRSIGRMLREEVFAPLAADFHIGAPESADVAEFLWPGQPPRPALINDCDLMRWNAYWNRKASPAAAGSTPEPGARRRFRRPTAMPVRGRLRASIPCWPPAARAMA